MTGSSMVTIIAPVDRARIAALRNEIGRLGNPASEAVRGKIEREEKFLHFASLHALAGSDGRSGFLVLEFSADQDAKTSTHLLAARWQDELVPIFRQAADWSPGAKLGDYLWKRHVTLGYGLFSNVGLAHCGTPDCSVQAIGNHEHLSNKLAELLSQQADGLSALGRLHELRRTIEQDEKLKWALETPPPSPPRPDGETGTWRGIALLAWPFVKTFCWPLLAILIPLAAWIAYPSAWQAEFTLPASAGGWLRFAIAIICYAAKTALIVLAATAFILALLYLAFRRGERDDWLSDRAPASRELEEIFRRENHPDHVQNHMVSHTVLKPGILRRLTIRLAFFVIAQLTARNPKRGHLGDIGTIHFARWVLVPGQRDLLFFSNYGGSWESYLEDFITKAHQGLTAVWSNSVGFPRTRNLFQDGATDGERFKRYARQSMIATAFWYAAYPGLTTANIRTNELIRRGFATAMTEDEAVRWLALFGSAPRPVDKLETTQIQSLVFGGLGFKPAGKLLTIVFSEEASSNREWLKKTLPQISFNDGRYARNPAVLTLGLTRRGLERLGLPDSAVNTFPAAFLGGMAGPGRDRILGDIGNNDSARWVWGRSGDMDAVLLVYGDDKDSVEEMCEYIKNWCGAHGAAIRHTQILTDVDKSPNKRIEPFGFVDGVSQPVIRGTYRGFRNADPIHLVEPGEFILGYPDNRGHIPPGPALDAQYDPDLRLPIAGKDQGFSATIAENPRMIGHNGSFLVIRQLEQDVPAFDTYCREQASAIGPAVANLPVETNPAALAELVAAKLIGRWKDGSSLVRFPYLSATRLKELSGGHAGQGIRPQARPLAAEATPIEHGTAPKTSEPSRPEIRPDNDFLFGTEDPQGLRCPFGAHVRRVNPRDSFTPGSKEQIDIVNRHRIMRVGRGYPGQKETKPGLMFMCLAGDIERQFEFIQQTWMGNAKFHGLTTESDPIITDGAKGRCGFTIPTRSGPIALAAMPQFVTMRGGGYFFLPGRQILDWLAHS